jgi:class 3 adenylate cyclase
VEKSSAPASCRWPYYAVTRWIIRSTSRSSSRGSRAYAPLPTLGLRSPESDDFDRLVEKHGLEKIKTTGDCYIVVSGVPHPRPDHLHALACLALNMVDTVAGLTDPRGHAVPMRIGIGAGPVVAGVVGSRRFFYDVWGDAVNVASRMESTGVEGRIQLPHDVYERLNDEFLLEDRGDVEVKGKRMMHTWFLVAQRELGSQREARANQDGACVAVIRTPAPLG